MKFENKLCYGTTTRRCAIATFVFIVDPISIHYPCKLSLARVSHSGELRIAACSKHRIYTFIGTTIASFIDLELIFNKK